MIRTYNIEYISGANTNLLIQHSICNKICPPLPHRSRGQQCRRVVAWPVVCCVATRRPPPELQSSGGAEQWRGVAALAGRQAALLHPALIHHHYPLCSARKQSPAPHNTTSQNADTLISSTHKPKNKYESPG